jgi:hypothetical protein
MKKCQGAYLDHQMLTILMIYWGIHPWIFHDYKFSEIEKIFKAEGINEAEMDC